MSNNDPVNPGGVPVFTGDAAVLEAKVKALSGDGARIASAAGEVHSTFGGLRAFYKAPEAEQLFATTRPVVQTATSVSSEVSIIAGALGTYASDIRPLVARLNQLRQDAADFRAKVDSDDTWNEDGDLVDENLARRNEIAEVWAAFQEAERACHAKIVALVGGHALKANDGSNKKNMYGYDAEALKQAESLPWGEAVQESTRWYQVWEHAYDFGTGFVVDGLGGTLAGLGTLVGIDGWDAAKQAWTGVAKLATGVVLLTTPLASIYLLMPDDKLHPWLRESRTALKETGKALVAWDQWGEKPGRAAGAATFNVVTTIFTGGAGGAVSGAGKAGAAAKAISLAGKASRAIDPMTYVFKGAGAGLAKIGDVMAGLKGMGNIEIPKINEGAFSLPDGSHILPDGTIQLPKGTAIPEGATRLPDGNTQLPEGTVTLPPGTVKLPADGPPQYMDPAGNLYNSAGDITQHAKDAKRDVVDNPKTATPAKTEAAPAKVEIREPAAVGARSGDNATHVNSDISTPAGTGDNLPGPRHETTPGSTADNTPRNSVDYHTSGTAGRRPDTPGTGAHAESGSPGGHTDGPGTGGTRTDSSTTGGGGRDLPGGSTADNGLHPETPGLDGLDEAARARDDATGATGAVDDASTPAGDQPAGGPPAPRQPVPRPDFMLDGPNPYGPRGRLTLEQIEEIQVYRANEEPGYLENYYQKNGHRLRLSLKDESGYTPTQLTQLSENGPWIRAKDTPEAPEPHFLDDDYIPVGRDNVTNPARLKVLDETAQTRHFAVAWDNLVEGWKKEAGEAHSAQETFESAGEWAEAKGTYKESHTQMGEKTEAFGEAAAEHHFIAERYPDFDKQDLLGPKNGNDQFDQVWKHEDGRLVVIEAKSSIGTDLGTRTLPPPSRRSVSQGSREYFYDILRIMEKRGESSLVADLERALEDGKLEYVVVKGEKNTGTYTGYQYRRFDISKGTLP